MTHCGQSCEIIENEAQILCDRICPETEPREIGWFDMTDRGLEIHPESRI